MQTQEIDLTQHNEQEFYKQDALKMNYLMIHILLNILSISNIPSATPFSPSFLNADTNEKTVGPPFLCTSSAFFNHALRHSRRQPSISFLLFPVMISSVAEDRPRKRPRL
uniref:Uncharacterized protein n=1 Tax=Amphimedon queenslandica TaxID=400682 RepID=A0A1X7SI82_AMPQE